jgi:hypothetical protein
MSGPSPFSEVRPQPADKYHSLANFHRTSEPLTEREQERPGARNWAVAGWGNPNCKGVRVWYYHGTGPRCQDVETQAASVFVMYGSKVAIKGYDHKCSLAKRSSAPEEEVDASDIGARHNETSLETRADAEWDWPEFRCLEGSVFSFQVNEAS